MQILDLQSLAVAESGLMEASVTKLTTLITTTPTVDGNPELPIN